MFVLAVQHDERRTEIAERGGGGERVVDEGAAASLTRDFAADDHLGAVGALENGLDGGEVLARADEVGARASTDEQTDRVDEDGLARARLAGNDVEAGFELHLELIDHGEMANPEKTQHVRTGTLMISGL